MRKPAKQTIVREIRRLHSRREPLNISAIKRNHPEMIKRVYRVRPFCGWKRALEDAGLDYSNINTELLDYVNCKICGQDFGAIGYHLVSQHQITPKEYRHEYPGAQVMCETIRAAISFRKQRQQPSVPHWEYIWSAEYTLDRMAELHRRKFPMNWDWVKDHESALSDKAIRYFGSWDKALRRIGLDPRRIRLFRPTWRGVSPWRGADKPAVVAELRRRNAAGEPLSWKTILPENFGSALLNRAKRLYGSWMGALCAAGLDPFHGLRSPWADANKAAVLAEIKRRKRVGASLGFASVASEKSGQPLLKRSKELFGSWREALLTAGIEYDVGRSHWADASKAVILAELRRRKRMGESLSSCHVAKEKRGRALQNRIANLFGTWNEALRAAGIEPVRENSSWRHAGRSAILSEIRRRHRAGESLATTKVERSKWGNPLINRAKELFGSWAGALLAAGADLPAGLTSPWPGADKLAIMAEIRRRKRAGASLRVPDIEGEMWGTPLLNRTRALFGSWNAGLTTALARS